MASKKEAPAPLSDTHLASPVDTFLLARHGNGYATLSEDTPENREYYTQLGFTLWAIEGTRLTIAQKPVEEGNTEQGTEPNPEADTQA